MEAAEYLFPRDLEVTASAIRSVLVIGDCISINLADRINEGGAFAAEHVLFHNVSELPSRSDEDLGGYDLQYIQLPLRAAVTDAIVRPAAFTAAGEFAQRVAAAEQRLDVMLDASLAYHRRMGLLTIVANFIVPQAQIAPSLADIGGPDDLTALVRRLNEHLARRIGELSGVYLADLDAVTSALGKRYFLNDLVFFYAHNSGAIGEWSELGRIEPAGPLNALYPIQTEAFFQAFIRQIEWIWRIANQIDQVKLVIFDLDDTLWRGLIGDDYVEGREWPHSHGWPGGIWETVQHLRWRGILTAICSKNDPGLVAERWSRTVNLPFLDMSDFTATRIGWDSKAQQVETLLEDMALTPRSVVFVDDNPVERASMAEAFPEMRTIGANPFVTRRVLLWSAETTPLSLSDESRRRDTMMRGQLDREQSRVRLSRDEFLQSLGTEIELTRIDGSEPATIGRALELLNRTNQFNTDGRRWSYVKLLAFLRRGGICLFGVRDRFADYGTVGVVLTREDEIVQFVMSCRVLGMGVEQAALSRIVDELRAGAERAVRALIVETSSNRPVRGLYAAAGFDEVEPGRYRLAVDRSVAPPPHIRFA